MKTRSQARRKSDDLRPEYDFDYKKARKNRFAGRFRGDSIAVVLDPDVAEVFDSQESVNAVLRALLRTMPSRPVKRVRKAS